MKALFLLDDINRIHWSMLKSVLAVLALLPASHGLIQLWQSTEGSSQIIVGFVAISLFSAMSILGFVSALLISQIQLQHDALDSNFEHGIFKLYRQLPMLGLMAMMSYLALQF